MAASEATDDRSSPEPETPAEEEEEDVAPKSAKTKKPRKQREPKAPKEKVPRGPGRPKGKSKPLVDDTPPIHDMVFEALDTLQERKGVSLQAIKRFMEENYKVDTQRQALRVRKVILAGVESGEIIRTHGVGALGRFKLKPSKAAVVHKRAAPEDYVQLPYGKSGSTKSTGKLGKVKKTVDTATTSSPPKAKGKRGRPKKK